MWTTNLTRLDTDGSIVTTADEPLEPITVWLSHIDAGTHGEVHGMITHDDETVAEVDMPPWLSLSAACAHVTGSLISGGFVPDGGWSVEYRDEDGNDHEVRRRFEPAP